MWLASRFGRFIPGGNLGNVAGWVPGQIGTKLKTFRIPTIAGTQLRIEEVEIIYLRRAGVVDSLQD
jgi:hypothetical protein